jgi:hypothetical protein
LEQSELEKLIEELESRVDRLRSLYEQYFMGLEKLVPAVAHKDVERRLFVLRRQTIRNTGLRFRFQNILLKYNTYQTYWIRIVRQIEEGTYKRDVRRANARFGAQEQAVRRRGRTRAERGAQDDDLGAVDVEFELDVDVDLDEAVTDLSTFEDEEIAKAHAEVAKMRAALQASRGQRVPVAPAPAPSRAAAPPPSAPEPESVAEPATEPKMPAARPSGPGLPEAPSAGLRYAVRGGHRASKLPPAFPIAGVDAASPPESTRRGASSRPAPRPSSRPMPVPAPSTRTVGKVRQQTPARPATPPNLSDERMRQIYGQLVETKRKVGESTAALTLESLSRTVRDSSEKLEKKHPGKNVDFEVTVKDGKAVLRPVVKEKK